LRRSLKKQKWWQDIEKQYTTIMLGLTAACFIAAGAIAWLYVHYVG